MVARLKVNRRKPAPVAPKPVVFNIPKTRSRTSMFMHRETTLEENKTERKVSNPKKYPAFTLFALVQRRRKGQQRMTTLECARKWYYLKDRQRSRYYAYRAPVRTLGETLAERRGTSRGYINLHEILEMGASKTRCSDLTRYLLGRGFTWETPREMIVDAAVDWLRRNEPQRDAAFMLGFIDSINPDHEIRKTIEQRYLDFAKYKKAYQVSKSKKFSFYAYLIAIGANPKQPSERTKHVRTYENRKAKAGKRKIRKPFDGFCFGLEQL